MKFFFVFFLYLTLCNVSYSNTLIETDSTKKVKYELGITPSAIFNIFHGIQLNHKYNISKRFYAGLETGYLFDRLGNNDKHFTGYRLRPSLGVNLYKNNFEGVDCYIFYNHRYEFLFLLKYKNIYH